MPSFGTILRVCGPIVSVTIVPLLSIVYAAITIHAHTIDDTTRDSELCGDWSWAWTTNRMIQLSSISMVGLAFTNAVMIKYLGETVAKYIKSYEDVADPTTIPDYDGHIDIPYFGRYPNVERARPISKLGILFTICVYYMQINSDVIWTCNKNDVSLWTLVFNWVVFYFALRVQHHVLFFGFVEMLKEQHHAKLQTLESSRTS